MLLSEWKPSTILRRHPEALPQLTGQSLKMQPLLSSLASKLWRKASLLHSSQGAATETCRLYFVGSALAGAVLQCYWTKFGTFSASPDASSPAAPGFSIGSPVLGSLGHRTSQDRDSIGNWMTMEDLWPLQLHHGRSEQTLAWTPH